MPREVTERLERSLLLHLLDHRGQQVRFEADQWTTEFGILRKFSEEDPTALKEALRTLEMSRWIYRRVQYVVGYSEPKLVFSLTPSGHRKALDLTRAPSRVSTDIIPIPEPASPDASRDGSGEDSIRPSPSGPPLGTRDGLSG